MSARGRSGAVGADAAARAALRLPPSSMYLDALVRLSAAGPLAELLADSRVTEVMVNGPSAVHVEVEGRLIETEVRFDDEHHLRSVIDRLLASTGRRVDAASPILDAVLADGSRVNVVLPPVAVGGPLLTIRRPRRERFDLADLVRRGTVPPAVAAFLHAAVLGRCNILVSGGASAGKTTVLAALCGLVPPDQRVVTIEDVPELRIEHPHVVSQQCRPATCDAIVPVDIRALVRNTLRMRPDRIVVGEVRGAEAADMVVAMNTGHPGSMSTVHANSASDALSRLEAMMLPARPSVSAITLRGWILAALDVVVHCDRAPSGERRIVEVAALHDGGLEVTWCTADGPSSTLRRPPHRCLQRMARHGVDFVPERLLRGVA